MHNLFGTDGIRARVGHLPFTDQGLVQFSSAFATWLLTHFGTGAHILMAHDTRASSAWIKSALKMGLLRHGIHVHDAYLLPTPALYALIAQNDLFAAGIMISASHNPYQDNGLKIIDRRSAKLSNIDEQYLNQLYFQSLANPLDYQDFGTEIWAADLAAAYQESIIKYFSVDFLKGLRIVLDAAHGATYQIAPAIFNSLGAQVIVINNTPSGKNINENCGAVHPQNLQDKVIAENAHFGFAFDGDGDRVTAVNRHGQIKDGDDILALLMNHPAYKNQNTIVGTVMTNYGFEQFLKTQNRSLARTNVGDKYVAHYLKEHQLLLGGEQAGHIILNDYLCTADGIFTALRILETALMSDNWDLSTFAHYPQITISVPVSHKKDLKSPELNNLIADHENQLQAGRLLVRYSGTENLLRVMVEDCNEINAKRICQSLSSRLQKELK